MDMIFGGNHDEPEWMTRVAGITGLKDYLVLVAPEKPMETIIVEHIVDKDLMVFDKGFLSYLEYAHPNSFGTINEYVIKGSPVILSLVIKEYEIADRLLGKIDRLSIRGIGRIEKQNNYGMGFGGNRMTEYSIENLLYESELLNVPQIRSNLLSRLENEAHDLYDFTLKQIKSFRDEAIKKQFCQDVKSYPKLYERLNCLYANDMDSLLFLIKVFSDDTSISRLLSNNSIGLYAKDCNLQNEIMEVIQSDSKALGRIIKLLKKRTDTHFDLVCFMLKIITQLRRRSIFDASAVDYYARSESAIWEYMMQLSFEEEDFYVLLSAADMKSFRTEIAYEFAHRKLGKKMDLYISDSITTLSNTFGLNDDADLMSLHGFLYMDDFNELEVRLFRLIHDTGKICYSDKLMQNPDKLAKELGSLLRRNADVLKDVFTDLLISGFVPEECLDGVMKKVNRNKKCIYMRPLLIAYKFGGLQYDEG